jgi:hypothetical protein
MSILAVQPSLAPGDLDSAATTRWSPLAEVIGADLTVPLVHGGATRYVNLDYAASAPALRAVADQVAELLPLYSSVHRRSAPAPTRPPGPRSAASSAPVTARTR